MNRKTFALVYVVVSSVANILFTALVEGVVIGITFLLMKYAFHARPEVYGAAFSSMFIVGLVVSFVLYSKISMKVIKKYKFDEIGKNPSQVNKSDGNAEPRKTVLPASVKESEEDAKWSD